MDIGILGTGAMGRALAAAWLASGHRVFLGSRERARGEQAAEGVRTRISPPTAAAVALGGTAAEAAEFGSAVLLAVPWTGVEATLEAVRRSLARKVLVDCTNPMVDARRPLVVGRTTSGAEEIQAAVPDCRVVKAFNALAARVIASRDANFAGRRAQVFHCGDDADARSVTARLVADTSFEPRDVGPLCIARYLEPLAALSVLLDQRSAVEIAMTELTRSRTPKR